VKMRLPLKRIVLLLLLAVLGLLMPMPELGRGGTAAANLLHAPCFAILAAIVFVLLRSRFEQHRGRLLVGCWVALVAFGVITEIAQHWFGRRASYSDLVANIAGVTAGLLIVSASTRSARIVRGAVALLLIGIVSLVPGLTLVDVAIAQRQFPQLASFEQPLEIWRWQAQHAKMKRTDEYAIDGDWSMQVELLPGRYPGVYLDLTSSDWSKYDTLVLDIAWIQKHLHSASDFERFGVIVKIEDAAHDGEYYDRFHETAQLSPGTNEIRIPLRDVAAAPRDRAMDMTIIRALQVFTIELEHPETLYIDNIRLEGQSVDR
jgi:VanZ family protein